MSSSSLLPPAGLDPRPRLLIVGCSTRAAAWSAVRAGFRPVCADQFGDEDLRLVAEVVPDALRDSRGMNGNPRIVAVANMRLTPITPEMWAEASSLNGIQRASAELRLIGPRLGPSASNPKIAIVNFLFHEALREKKLPALATKIQRLSDRVKLEPLLMWSQISRAEQMRARKDVVWIEKAWSSGGGRGVQLRAAGGNRIPFSERTYLQEYKPGQPMSAICIGRKDGVKLLGLTQQLIGDPVASPPWPFGYCGNIAPVSLPDAGRELIVRMAEVLAARFELRGLFGLDFLWDGATPWVCEVNPRYTASCELLELASGRPLLTEHWSCFTADPPPTPPVAPPVGGQPDMVGKLILYARRAATAPDLSRFLSPRSPWTVPFLADVPRVGTPFEPGQPLCTVFATGRTADAVRQKLYRRAARVRQWFGDAEPD